MSQPSKKSYEPPYEEELEIKTQTKTKTKTTEKVLNNGFGHDPLIFQDKAIPNLCSCPRYTKLTYDN